MVKVDVYNGNQIGGNVTVITRKSGEGAGEVTHRIMIDYGECLPGNPEAKNVDYPWALEKIDAVFITHYHGDHAGRLLEIPKDVPIYMGSTTRKILLNIRKALCKRRDVAPKVKEELAILEDDSRIHEFHWNGEQYDAIEDIPHFRVEPYSVDHSAYDAYMFLIEVDEETAKCGKRVILHTGDFREHGRRGKALIPMIWKYIRKCGERAIDTLLIEGTMLGREEGDVMKETVMQKKAGEIIRSNPYVFLVCSSTNLDSLTSFYRALKGVDKKRPFVVYSPYVEMQLKTFSETAGHFSKVYSFEDVTTDTSSINGQGFLALIKPERYNETYIEVIMEAYEKGLIKSKPVLIYSMWDGYLDADNPAGNAEWIAFINRQKERGMDVIHLHTSGHASKQTLKKVIRALAPGEVVPMHTNHPKELKQLVK